MNGKRFANKLRAAVADFLGPSVALFIGLIKRIFLIAHKNCLLVAKAAG